MPKAGTKCPQWEPGADCLIEEHADEGAAAIRAALAECGYHDRTEEAIRRHAYRIGMSVPKRPLQVCPMCGARVERLARTSGLCPACNMRERTRRFAETSKKRRQEAADNERRYRDEKREYDRLCKREERAR